MYGFIIITSYLLYYLLILLVFNNDNNIYKNKNRCYRLRDIKFFSNKLKKINNNSYKCII